MADGLATGSNQGRKAGRNAGNGLAAPGNPIKSRPELTLTNSTRDQPTDCRNIASGSDRLRIRLLKPVFRRFGNSLDFPVGSVPWLIGAEFRYGGIHRNVPRLRVSSLDPRSREELARGGMIGGDRMLHHG